MRLMVEETKKGGAGKPAAEVEALLGGLRFVEEATLISRRIDGEASWPTCWRYGGSVCFRRPCPIVSDLMWEGQLLACAGERLMASWPCLG